MCAKPFGSVFGFIAIYILFGFQGLYAQEATKSDKAAEYFFFRCAGCHTVGGGKLSGPDLISSTKWADADLKASIKKMEKNVGPLSETDIAQLVSFLKDMNVSSRIVAQKQKVEESLKASLPAPSYAKGEQLFKGHLKLSNGGPSCIGCHQFGSEGGTLGFNLTQVKDRLSSVALQSGITNAAYKVMQPIYEKHPITPEEALHITEFLMHPEKIDATQAPMKKKVIALAYGALLLFFILLWRFNKTRKGDTRINLVQKSKRGNAP